MDAQHIGKWGILGKEALDRLQSDNDIKIIIQGKNSQTGIGKTTLAIELCRYIDQNGWDATEKAYIDVRRYLNNYLDVEPQSALLLDEIGQGADARRATSSENVDLSHGWQMLRSRNVATVATLPSTNTLDKRLLELADYWVLVKKRGVAQPYEIRVNDFNGKVSRKPLPGEQHITFPDLPDSDDDKQHLDKIKDQKVRDKGVETIKKSEHRKKLEKAEQDARKGMRDKMIRSLYHETEMSYRDIGELDPIDLTKQTVSQIVRDG